MKSLKEFLDIKNQKHLNESFKSSILQNAISDLNKTVLLDDLNNWIYYNKQSDSFGNTRNVIIELVLQIKDIFKKYLNANDSEFNDFQKDILDVFSLKNLSNAEEKTIKDIKKKTVSINNGYDLNKIERETEYNFDNDLEYVKKTMINSFGSKFNSRKLFNDNERVRYESTFNVSEITDDMFDVYSAGEIENIKPGMSPMIIVDNKDRVFGVTSGHNIIMALDPYTLLDPNEESSAALFHSAESNDYLRNKKFFPLEIIIDKPTDTKTLNSFDSDYELSLSDIKRYLISNKFDKNYMENSIIDIEKFEKGLTEPLSDYVGHNVGERTYNNSVYYYVRKFVNKWMNPLDEYAWYVSKYAKVKNPFNFRIAANLLKNNGSFKFKDLVNIVSKLGSLGKIYVLKNEIYKEKKNKETGILEPVHKELIDTEKFKNRTDWKEYSNYVKSLALENIKRYNKILKERATSSSNIDILRDLTNMMNELKAIQIDSHKLFNFISTKYFDITQNMFDERTAKKNIDKLNKLWATDDAENNDNNYIRNYINKNKSDYATNSNELNVISFIEKTKSALTKLDAYCLQNQEKILDFSENLLKDNNHINYSSIYYSFTNLISRINNNSMIKSSSMFEKTVIDICDILNKSNGLNKNVESFLYSDATEKADFIKKWNELCTKLTDYIQKYSTIASPGWTTNLKPFLVKLKTLQDTEDRKRREKYNL